MTRFVTTKPKVPLAELERRASTHRVTHLNDWSDPFPLGFGTEPEKRVYEALSRRGIPFLYLNDIRLQIPEIEFDQFYQADFIIPSLRIIIEVQGAHWHSMPKTIEEDAFKFALYQQTGWRPLAWWDFDILDNVNKLFAADPQLSQYNYIGADASTEMAVQRRTKTDSSQGIRTVNQKRGQRLQYKRKAVGVRTKRMKAYTYASNN